MVRRALRVVPVALLILGAAGGYLAHQNSPAASVPAETVSAQKPALTVTTVRPARETWAEILRASGSLAAWREATVATESGGSRVVEIAVDVGDTVKAGQGLVRLGREDAEATLRKREAAAAQAGAALTKAVGNGNRARALRSGGALSEQTITEYLVAEAGARADLASAEADVDTARIALDHTVIRAPDDGVIISRSATLGGVVSVGTELFKMIRQGRVEWNAEVDAEHMARVSPDMAAAVTLPEGRVITGAVRSIEPTLSASTGRGLVHISLPSDTGARVGAYVEGEIQLGATSALTVPSAAVVPRDGRNYVFTVGDDMKTNRAPVTTGRRQNGRVEILSGLDPNSTVVATGGAFLNDGVTVAVADRTGPRS